MGCDIHAVIEVYHDDRKKWVNVGDPLMYRNYTIFAALGDVRNWDSPIPCIAKNRLHQDEDENFISGEYDDRGIEYFMMRYTSGEFNSLAKEYASDGHSHSFATLREIKAYTGFPDDFDCWEYWNDLVTRMEVNASVYGVTNPDHIRLVFFFDC